MKTIYLVLLMLGLTSLPLLSQNIQDLPIRNDFSLFYGTEIGIVYPGWSEANGYTNPVPGESAWYSSNVLFNKAVGVSFSGNLYSEWLITPQFVATSHTKLNFYAALTRFYDDPALGHFGYDDSLTVMISKDGINYQPVFAFTQFSNLSATLKPFEIQLGEFAGETISIAFYATDGAEPTGYAAFHMDNMVIKNTVEIDAAVCSINKPLWNSCLTENTPIEITLKNDGTETLWNIPVRVRLRGTQIENYYSVYQGPIEPGQIINYTAAHFDLSSPGNYRVFAETENVGDGDSVNNFSDTLSFEKVNTSMLPLPVLQFTDFYYYNLFELYGWREARGKNSPQAFIDTDWQGEMFDGSRAASVYFVNLGTEDWLIGPIIECTENTSVSFKAGIRPEIGDNMGSDDKFALMVSVDCGTSWSQVNAVTATNNLDTIFSDFEFSLANYAGQQIRVAFYATTGNTQNYEKYLFYIDDISFLDKFDNDLAINSIVNPGSACSYSSSELLTIQIQNTGRQNISNIPASFSLNSGTQISEIISQTLEPGQSLNYTFSHTLNLTQFSENYISVSLPWDQDQNNINNQINDYLIKPQSFNLAEQGTYQNGFENISAMDGWLIENTNNDVSTWTNLNNTEYAYQGNYSYFYSSNNTAVPSNDWLFSPCFWLESGQTYHVSFYYRNRATSFPEKLRLKLGQNQHSQAMTQTLIDLGPISNSTYNQAQTTFTVANTGSYYFGWQAYGDPDMFAMHIDNVEIFQIFETDAKITAIRVPRTKDQNCLVQEPDTILIDVYNQGNQTIYSIPVNVKLNEMNVVEYNFNKTIAQNQTATLKFPVHLNSEITYNIAAWTEVSGDNNFANDTAFLEAYSLQNYQNGFEAFENSSEWSQLSISGVNTWGNVADQSVSHSGTNCYGIRTDGAGGNTSNNDWLFSECLYLETGKCYELSYFYRSRYSTENLGIYIGNSANPSNMVSLYNLENFNSNIYLNSSYVFGVPEDGIYYLGWNTTGGTSGRYYIYIDDIKLIESSLSPIANINPYVLDREVYFSSHFENINQVNWDFGDGTNSVEFSPSHTYQEPGEYFVTLIAQNLCGQIVLTDTILIDYELMADFSYVTDSALLSCTAITPAVAWEWDFGDGNHDNGNEVENLYSNPGTYTVKLTSYSSYGIETNEKNIQIDFSDIVTNKNNMLQVFPNPVNEILTIQSKNIIDSYSVTNVFGSIISNKEKIEKTIEKIDFSDLLTGVYILKVKSGKAISIVKIIKN